MNPMPMAFVGLRYGYHAALNLRESEVAECLPIVAVCDLDSERAQKAASEFDAQVVGSLEEILGMEEIRAVGLYTPPAGRAELIRKIIHAGKDVMTTKPFETDPEAALDILNEAKEMGRVVHLNSPSPLWPPDLTIIRDWHKEFDLGRPIAMRTETWADYHEKADGGWYDDPKQCPVAPLFRIGIYSLNDAIRLFGKVDSVQVMANRIRTGRPTPDNAQMAMRFDNGALGSVFASFCIGDRQFYKSAFMLHYERGSIYRNAGVEGGMFKETKLEMVTHDTDGNEITREVTVTFSEGSGMYQWSQFHRAVLGEGGEEDVNPEEIVEGIRVVQAMAMAERSGELTQVRPG